MVILGEQPYAPRYAVYSASIRGDDGKPLYIAGFNSAERRAAYLERAGDTVAQETK